MIIVLYICSVICALVATYYWWMYNRMLRVNERIHFMASQVVQSFQVMLATYNLQGQRIIGLKTQISEIEQQIKWDIDRNKLSEVDGKYYFQNLNNMRSLLLTAEMTLKSTLEQEIENASKEG